MIGAVLIHGARAPRVLRREQLALMKKGAVLVDVSIDQGGCFETSRPTSHSDPTYEVDGIIHYCVTNMPGAVPITSTYALTNATLPYVQVLADHGVAGAVSRDPGLRLGVNVAGGKVTNPAVASSLGVEFTPLEDALRPVERASSPDGSRSALMRLVTYRSERGSRAGVLRDGRVLDAWDALAGEGESMRDLLSGGELVALEASLAGEGVPLDQVALEPPVPDPEKIVCIGLNYRSHAEEAGIEPPSSPTFFAKYRNALVARRRRGAPPRGEHQGRLRGGGRLRDRSPLP